MMLLETRITNRWRKHARQRVVVGMCRVSNFRLERDGQTSIEAGVTREVFGLIIDTVVAVIWRQKLTRG